MNAASHYLEAWNGKPLIELMNHIVEMHHSFCRREAARLSSLFKQTIAAHSKNYAELKKMEALFARMAKDLEMHLLKEERTLFPYIARVEAAIQQNDAVTWPPFGTVENPIRMMVLEHDQTGEELSHIRRLTNNYILSSDAPEPVAALYDGLRSFEQDMNRHIHAEDHLLFPRAVAMEEQACTRGKRV
ncbi:MAG TPA: hemerythrin domain-containing protein [Bryobacteraceae bacterium]